MKTIQNIQIILVLALTPMTFSSCTSTGDFSLGKTIASAATLAGGVAMADLDSDAAASFVANSLTQINTDGEASVPSPSHSSSEIVTTDMSLNEGVNYSPSDASKSNLIDQYGLSHFRNASDDDHIVYYIKTADIYFKSYKETGDPKAYDAHKKTADIARQFQVR